MAGPWKLPPQKCKNHLASGPLSREACERLQVLGGYLPHWERPKVVYQSGMLRRLTSVTSVQMENRHEPVQNVYDGADLKPSVSVSYGS